MARHLLLEQEPTRDVIGAFYTVYDTSGHGYLEKLYARALEHELRMRGHEVGREVPVGVIHEGKVPGVQRLDMVVDHKPVVEVKSTELLHPMARRQLFNYLESTSLEVGLLLQFGPRPRFYRLIHSNRASSPGRGEN